MDRIKRELWFKRAYFDRQNKFICFSYWGKNIDSCGNKSESIFTNPASIGGAWHFLDNQYTGLKDKNGVKTFDDDIAKYIDDSGAHQIGIITWCEFKYSIIAIGGDEEGNQDIELHPDYEWVVIGNVHENPELLEKK